MAYRGKARIREDGFVKKKFLERAMAHSRSAHGNESPCPTCAECKRISVEALADEGLTVEDVQDLIVRGGVPEDLMEGADIFMQMFPRVSPWD